uniref:Berberine/berberine-like domain-containing protein n=1 Tax=Ditylenchus dipsaci TaxID=166011 RepID=A0A915DTG5_9BILA
MAPINPWTEHTPLSQLAVGWILAVTREFPLPYEKRAYITEKINSPKWPEWVSNRLDIIQSQDQPDYKGKRLGLKAASQIQTIGGPKSMYYLNGLRKSANARLRYLRRMKIAGVDEDKRKRGIRPKWNVLNVPLDRNQRFLWGTYGDRNMGNVWQHYYTPEQYKRLVRIKNKWDPAPTTFIANQFCVGVAPNSEDIPPANNSASISSSIFPQIAALQHVPSSAARDWTLLSCFRWKGLKLRRCSSNLNPCRSMWAFRRWWMSVYQVVEDSQRPVDEEEL